MKKLQDTHITFLDMRLQLLFLAASMLLERCSAYVIPDETNSSSNVKNDSANSSRTADRPMVEVIKNNNIKFPFQAFRPTPDKYLHTMQPQINAFGPRSLKRLSVVPLRGFFAFRSPQTGVDQVHQDELVNITMLNCDSNSTNCQNLYPPRQISKRMAMGSGVPRTRRPYDVPQIGSKMQDLLEELNLPDGDDPFVLNYKAGYVDPDTVTPFEMTYKYYNRLWADTQAQIGYILQQEPPLDEPPEVVAERFILIRRVSKMYLQYIGVTNKIIKCYEHIAQPQKRIFLRKLTDACICRVLELKHELTALENSDFHFLDNMLLSLKMLPKDMEIKTPEYFRDHTEDENERKKIVTTHLNVLLEKEKSKYIVTEKMKFVRTAMVFIRMIQSHERARQSRDFFHDCQKKCIVKELNKRREDNKESQINKSRQNAAVTIQRAWRVYILRKSLKRIYFEEMDLLRMLPRSRKDRMGELEKDRLDIIKRNEVEFQKARNHLQIEVLTYKVPEMMEVLEDKIRSYFENYFSLFGSYPVFPAEEEGGSTKMFEVSVDIDEEATDVTVEGESKPETSKQSQKDTQSSKSTKDTTSTKDTKNKDDKSKASDPDKPEVFSLKPSKCLSDLISLQEEYNSTWLGKKPVNFDRYDYNILKDEIEKEAELQVRLVVDEKMRLELEKLTNAYQKDAKIKPKKGKGKKKGKEGKKGKGKKVKKEKDLTPGRTLDSLVEELVSQGIIISYPKYKLCDFLGDYNYAGSAQHLAGDPKNDPIPCLGDIRRVVSEYCILPMGSEEIHMKGAFVRSLLIAGPKGVGKKSLIYAACNEIDATMMDLSAENIEGKYPGKEGKAMLLHLVLKVGRLLQPTIIFVKDAENYFYKKKPATCTLSDPGRLKKDLPKFAKGIRNEDRIMICGTTVLPFDVNLKALGSAYNKVICIFKPDYNCRRSLWREMIIREKGILTNKLDMTVLCNVSDGFTAASIETSVKQILTDRRLAFQKKIPISAADFLSELANHTPVYEEENEAYQQWMDKMPLQKKRTETLELEKEDEEVGEDESEEED